MSNDHKNVSERVHVIKVLQNIVESLEDCRSSRLRWFDHNGNGLPQTISATLCEQRNQLIEHSERIHGFPTTPAFTIIPKSSLIQHVVDFYLIEGQNVTLGIEFRHRAEHLIERAIEFDRQILEPLRQEESKSPTEKMEELLWKPEWGQLQAILDEAVSFAAFAKRLQAQLANSIPSPPDDPDIRKAIEIWNASDGTTWTDVAGALGHDEASSEAVRRAVARFAKANGIELKKKNSGRKPKR
ncbi:MAG: hypothetical protein EB060_11005 [Proteobacteria bacterium]|nr:hypothetical protein [Pseudomonadota bacterium]